MEDAADGAGEVTSVCVGCSNTTETYILYLDSKQEVEASVLLF